MAHPSRVEIKRSARRSGGWRRGRCGEFSDGRILTEQPVHFQQTKDAVLGHTVIGLAVVFLLWNAGEDQTNLVIWTILMLTVAVVRIVLYGIFPDKTSSPDATPWAWRFRAISLA